MRGAGVVVVWGLAVWGCAGHSRPASVRVPESVLVAAVERGTPVVVEVPLEQYVAAAILAEFAPGAGEARAVGRMFEVQAVVSRTYAVAHRRRHGREGFDFCSATHCQLYDPARRSTSRWAAIAQDAVRRTRGQVLWFADRPAEAVFHADCGGRTSASADVWGTDHAYLPAQADDGPAADAHAGWTFTAAREPLRAALNADPRTAVGARLDAITIAARDRGGRVTAIALSGEQSRRVRGDIFRDALTRVLGARSLRSTLFEVASHGPDYTFSGRGFGHGVGLCQAGAYARLTAGATPAQVLAHYFPGTSLAPR